MDASFSVVIAMINIREKKNEYVDLFETTRCQIITDRKKQNK